MRTYVDRGFLQIRSHKISVLLGCICNNIMTFLCVQAGVGSIRQCCALQEFSWDKDKVHWLVITWYVYCIN